MKTKLKALIISIVMIISMASSLYAAQSWYDNFSFSVCRDDEGLDKSGKIVVFFNSEDFKSRVNLEKEIVTALTGKGLKADSISKNFFSNDMSDKDFNIFKAAQALNPRYLLIIENEDLKSVSMIINWETITYVFDYEAWDYVAQISCTENTSHRDFDVSYAQSLKEVSPLMADSIAEEYCTYVK